MKLRIFALAVSVVAFTLHVPAHAQQATTWTVAPGSGTTLSNPAIGSNGAVTFTATSQGGGGGGGGGGLSPDGTISNAPSGASLTGVDGVWSWGASAGGGEYQTLLNGSAANGGTAVEMEVFNSGHLYAKGANGLWYVYNASSNTWPQTAAP